VHQAEQGQQQHDAGSDEGDYRRDTRDRCHGSEGVGVEQQPSQRLTLEQRGHLALELEVVGAGLRQGAELGVGLAAAGLHKVHGDEMIGVGFSLRTGGQVPGVKWS